MRDVVPEISVTFGEEGTVDVETVSVVTVASDDVCSLFVLDSFASIDGECCCCGDGVFAPCTFVVGVTQNGGEREEFEKIEDVPDCEENWDEG